MTRLDGRTVLLTGAAGGIGRYLAAAVAAQGARLLLAGREPASVEALAAELRRDGAQAVASAVDLASSDGPAQLHAWALSAAPSVDILVNNAAVEALGRFEDMEPDAIARTLHVNLTSALSLTALVLPDMLERERGHVVNLSSVLGLSGIAFHVAYCASKFGLVGATQALRSEYHGTGVHFSVVCPGFVRRVGMSAWVDQAPRRRLCRLMGASTPERVAEATVRAIVRERPQVIVNPRPVRPLLSLMAILPGVTEPLTRWMGGPALYRSGLTCEAERSVVPASAAGDPRRSG